MKVSCLQTSKECTDTTQTGPLETARSSFFVISLVFFKNANVFKAMKLGRSMSANYVIFQQKTYEPVHEKTNNLGRAVQSQKTVRSLKFLI